MRKLVLALAAVSLAGIAPAASPPAKSPIAAAVANPARSADNAKLDAGRKPAQVLSFLGLKRGMHAIDLFGGNRYWSEIMAPVVGPKGKVLVWQPGAILSAEHQDCLRSLSGQEPERVDRCEPVRGRRASEEFRRFRDHQRQLPRHLLAQ